MIDVLRYAVQGLPIGCVFGLLAVGLVLNYKTSGVFNLAFAAQAYTSAAVFYVTRQTHDWPLVPAAALSILVVGPLLGYVLDRSLYRHLRTATPLVKLVTSLGLLVAMPEIVKLVFGFGEKPQYRPPVLWPVERVNDLVIPHKGAAITLNAAEISTIVFTALVLIGLAVLFGRTALGLRMRAVVESPRLVELAGIDADRVSLKSWMLSSLIAGLSGVLVAPLFASLVANDFFTLLVAALAATVFAHLVSIPKAFVGGLALGVLQAVLAGTLPQGTLADAVRPSLPFIVLFVLLVGRLALASIRGTDVRFTREVTDPLAGVDPPPPAPIATIRPRFTAIGSKVIGAVVVIVLTWLCWSVFDTEWRSLIVGGICLGVILMSMVMMTGVGGTISLSQASFAAIGAFSTAQLVKNFDLPVLAAMLAGALVAAAVGAVLALPVIRLSAVYAALATLAFALMFESMFKPLPWVSGGSVPITVPRPVIGPIDFTDDRYFMILAGVVAAIVGVLVILVRQGTTGRYLDAVRDSEAGAASIGISPPRQRFAAFVMAAGIAGLGGGLTATWVGQASYEANFVFFYGLVWLTLVVSAGSRSIQAAITSGIGFYVIPKLLENLFSWPGNHLAGNPDISGGWRTILAFPDPTWGQGVAFILFGIGALTYAKHPEGMIEFQTTAAINRTLRVVDRLKGREPGTTAAMAEART